MNDWWPKDIEDWFALQRTEKGRSISYAYRKDTLMMSAVESEALNVASVVEGSGFVRWKFCSFGRARSFRVTAHGRDRRILWDSADAVCDSLSGAPSFLVELPPGIPDAVPPVNEFTCRFLVHQKGSETVLSLAEKSKTQLSSRFDAMKKHDWLLAISKGVEAIPGAKVLLGPLIHLRESEKAAERNAAIDQLFDQQHKLTEKVLDSIEEIRGALPEQIAAREILVQVLDQEFSRTRGAPLPQAPPLSTFPLPFSRGLLLQELLNLFSNAEDVRVCLLVSDYPVIDEPDRTKFLSAFVSSLVGQRREVLASVFHALHNKRPGSKLLEFATAHLAGS